MSLNPLKREIYEYVRIHGEVSLDELCDQFDASDNNVYGAAKHLKWDGYLTADTGNNVWQITKGVPGLCPECGDECEWGEGMEQFCPRCEWEYEWECPNCGSTDPHHGIEFPQPDDERFADMDMVVEAEVEVDITCESVYITPVDETYGDGFAFTHDEFETIMEHYRQSDYTEV